jgi:hypothetical protein
VDAFEHPIRQYLHVRTRPEPAMEQPVTTIETIIDDSVSDTLEDLILRQLRPRVVSLIAQREAGSESGAIRSTAISNAMDRLRRHLRSSNSMFSEAMGQPDNLEPRDRLDMARFARRPRLEPRVNAAEQRSEQIQRHSSAAVLSESFQRWTMARRQMYQRADQTQAPSSAPNTHPASETQPLLSEHSTDTPTITTAREVYQQTALRLQRTRELLSNRQQQHRVLSERLQESTQAIGRHIENLRDALRESGNLPGNQRTQPE